VRWQPEGLFADRVNHISPASDEFQDFLKKGDASKTADMWIDWNKFWPKGEPQMTHPH
jgi:sucrose phosphorylase